MTRKNWMLIVLAVVLGSISLYINRDWFASERIQIMSRSLPRRPGFFNRARPNSSSVLPVAFGLNRKFKLTDIKVVELSDLETNKHPHALWHLITESNSVPLREFFYGAPIRGMHPEYKGSAPEPLEPGKKYRLFLSADGLKGEHDFEPTAPAQ